MRPGLSLADKCLLLFGVAIVFTVLAASSAPWLRMNALVDQGQLQMSRELVAVWERVDHESRDRNDVPTPTGTPVERAGVSAERLTLNESRGRAPHDGFIFRAVTAFENDPALADVQQVRWEGTTRVYRYARAIRSGLGAESKLEGMIVLDRRPLEAARLLLVNSLYLLSAGLVVLGVAVLAFYVITHRLVLAPVRSLKNTAERVREGNLAVRSDITTGDEFEELAETFNVMLGDLQTGQDQLRSINSALDVKVNELVRANLQLFDVARHKGEFLANISHELRTPLNSIIGFAELLHDIARNDVPTDGELPMTLAKRLRYCDNILTAGRNLLDMINSLLEMARIEAGKIEVTMEPVILRDLCDSLAGLIFPQADRRGITLRLEVPEDLPVVETDGKKLRQIIFNFLSNAVKFTEPQERTGKPGIVTLRAERLIGGAEGVRISVIDTGPGIPHDQQSRVFEKFHQLDGGHTREYAGTGLGLAISKELADLIGAEIQLVSDPGIGSMFSVIVPVRESARVIEAAAP